MAKLGQIGKAKDALDHAAKLGASNTARWSYVQGCVMYQRGLYARARHAFGKAFSADADNILHLFGLAASSYRAGNLDHAQKITRACVEQFPMLERAGGIGA